MSGHRTMQRSNLWNVFRKNSKDLMARCLLCSKKLSYRTSITNLKTHLRRKHPLAFKTYLQQCGGATSSTEQTAPTLQDDDSNSSVKFSAEVWGYFEHEDSQPRCVLCQSSVSDSIEDMKTHLEETHPGVLIDILKRKPHEDENFSDEDNTEEATADEDIFTEIVYLEDEPKPKPPKRANTKQTEVIKGKPKIEIPHAKENPRPEIDSFLNYVGVLLKSVPKETIPKLQLDIISLILNAQMAQTSVSQIPVTQVSMTPVTVSNILSTPVNVVNSTVDYHIINDGEPIDKS